MCFRDSFAKLFHGLAINAVAQREWKDARNQVLACRGPIAVDWGANQGSALILALARGTTETRGDGNILLVPQPHMPIVRLPRQDLVSTLVRAMGHNNLKVEM